MSDYFRSIVVTLSILIPSVLVANTDSLLKVWNNKELADTTRMNACSEVLEIYWQEKNSMTDSLVDIFRDLALNSNIGKYKSNYYSFKGLILNIKGQTDSAITLHNLALKLRKKANLKAPLATTYNNLGTCFASTGRFDSALVYFEESYRIFSNTKSSNIVWPLGNLAMLLTRLNQPEKAMEFCKLSMEHLPDSTSAKSIQIRCLLAYNYYKLGKEKESLELLEDEYYNARKELNNDAVRIASGMLLEIYVDNGDNYGRTRILTQLYQYAKIIKDTIMQANSLGNLGAVYSDLGDSTKTLEYSKKTIELINGSNNYLAIGMCYTNMCYTYGFQGKTFLALKNCSLCNDILTKSNHVQMQGQNLNNFGNIYKRLADSCRRKENMTLANKHRNSAFSYYYKSLNNRVKSANIQGQVQTMTNMAWLHYYFNKLDSSLFYAKKALEISRDKIHREARDAAEILYLIYKKSGDLANSFEAYEYFVNTRDLINNQENSRKIAELEFQSKYKERIIEDSLNTVKELARAKKEEIALLKSKKRKNRLQLSGIIILVLLLGGLISFIGRLNINKRLSKALIFIFFLLVFEFVLVIMDPIVEIWSDGEIGIKLLIDSAFAVVIFFGHQFFERTLRQRLLNSD